MKPFSQDWLAELNLSPLWRALDAEVAGAIESPEIAATAISDNQRHQEIHNRGYLPHLKAEGGIYFVTFRLTDSLPQSALDELQEIPPEVRSKKIETYLDAGHGECLLRNPEIAQLVVHALKTFDGERYVLHDWVVMPNHVHLVIEPRGEHALSDILHSLKSYTASEANRILDRHGVFWQNESYNRLLRNQDEFDRCLQYVQQNPVRAKLVSESALYAYGRAGFVVASNAEAVIGKDAGAIDVQQLDTSRNIDAETERPSVAPPSLPATGTTSDIQQLDWQQLKQTVAACTLCPLHAGRTQTVFGVGDEQADVLFLGEGPGEEEDQQGKPFVGQAGNLLDNMLASIDLTRDQNVYITNVVKCHPQENRNPEPSEVAACAPYLEYQIALIQPKLIVALGKVAATRLLGKEASIASLRGKLLEYQGRSLIVTYHPAYLLRSPTDKSKAWEDLCLIKRTLQGLQKP